MVKRAFSLIELLVVIAIIGVLAALTMGGISLARKAARTALTAQRMQEVIRRCQELGSEESSAALMIQKQLATVPPPRQLRCILELLYVPGGDRFDVLSGTWAQTPLHSWEFAHPWGRPACNYPPGHLNEANSPSRNDECPPDDHALRDLTASYSAELLALAKLLPADNSATPGNESLEAYQLDRSPDQAWNDAWGNPLVIGFASYQPRRNTVTTSKETHSTKGGTATVIREDLYLRRCEASYGYTRGVYLAIGAFGPHSPSVDLSASDWTTPHSGVLDLCWQAINQAAGEDQGVALWRTDAAAGVNAFTDPPWDGVRTKGALLSTPVELH